MIYLISLTFQEKIVMIAKNRNNKLTLNILNLFHE